MGVIASHITSLTIVYSTVYSGADQRKHQSSASLAFVRGIHRSPVNSPRKGPVTRKSFHLMTSSWFHWPIYKYHRWRKETKKYWSLPWWLTIKDILPSLFDISFLELHEWRDLLELTWLLTYWMQSNIHQTGLFLYTMRKHIQNARKC